MTDLQAALAALSPDEIRALLADRGDIRILNKLVAPALSPVAPEEPGYLIVLDTEGTGTDSLKDELLELGMLKVLYCRKTNRLCQIVARFNQLRDPGIPIPPEATAVNGITDDDVRGKSIDFDLAAEFVADADWVIAHNASYDRPMCERYIPILCNKAWGCSFRQVDWNSVGISSGKLDYIAMKLNFFYDAHRAEVDCEALLHVLGSMLEAETGPTTPFEQMVEAASQTETRIYAFGSPFEKKDVLKERDYRWHDGATGPEKAWYVNVVGDEAYREEIAWLRETVYGRRAFAPGLMQVDAFSRYSMHMPPVKRDYI